MNKSIAKTIVPCLLFAALLAQAESGKLDISDPDQALQASNKLFCDNQPGEVSLFWWEGVVYSRIPGEKDRHLFNVQGMNARQCARLEDEVRGLGFRSVSREIMLYLDPQTNEILKSWDNPWTGESVEVMQVHNDPVNSRGPRWSRDTDGNPSATFDNMTVINGVGLQGGGAARLFYDNPLQGEYQEYEGGKYHASEFLSIAYPMEDALDASRTAIQDAVISWGRVSGWLPWMKMRGRSGLMVHYTHGMRLHDWEDLPDLLQKEIETNYPKFMLPPPVDDKRPNETTWTVFKRIIDERREQDSKL